MSDGLELYYNYEADTTAPGGILDASGNTRNGSGTEDNDFVSGTIDYTFASDVPAALTGSTKALDLSATTDFIVSDTPGYTGIGGTGDRTVATWIKVDPTDIGSTTLVEWGENANGNRWSFRINYSGQGLVGGIRTEVQGGFNITDGAVNDGEWHHVAAVLVDDGSPDVLEVLMYIDGVLQGSSGSGDEPIDTLATSNVVIGNSNKFVDVRQFTGLMDDTAIWSRALSAQEIADLAAGASILGGPALPGDTDADGDIDDTDLGTAFSNYTGPQPPGTGGKTAADGDTDGDGDIDDTDLGTIFSGYTGPLGPESVPEPGSLALIGLGGLMALRRRR
ncbi:MAG: LamG-like jellyroll fold domain-containing protein [Phycisphaeraceae bacterium]